MALPDLQALRLIGITDRHAIGMGSLARASELALEGGLPALMLREKDLTEEEALPLAREIRALTGSRGRLLIVNRRLEVARAVQADGVHLGADGPTIVEARRAMGTDAVLGYSAHDVNEALRAFESGADYVIFSPIFETPSKRGVLRPVGLEALGHLARVAPGPVIALGGISAVNAGAVAETGAAGVAVVRAIFAARDPAAATRELLEAWDRASSKSRTGGG